MGNLTAFLAQNAKQVENVRLVVSDRFTDEDGKPLEWEVRCISSREDETLRRDCQYRVQVPGKRGSFRQEFDNVLYLAKLAAACTVYPNLNDAELQDSYGTKCAEELISAMLTPGEYTNYTEKLFDICGEGSDDYEAYAAHYCLQKLHILPSEYLSLPKEERAFIWASCVVHNEDEKAALDKAKRGR